MQYQLLQFQPKIVFTLPTQSDMITIYNNSPIKQFHHILKLQQVTRDYQMLFGQLKHEQQQKQKQVKKQLKEIKQVEKGSNKDKQMYNGSYERRKLNMGQKIRNKLESTTNKSQEPAVQQEVIQVVSRFSDCIDQNSSQESQLYQSQDDRNNRLNKINDFVQLNQQGDMKQSHKSLNHAPSFSANQFPYGNNGNIENHINSEIKHSQISPNQKNSQHSSPYNNISAKTHYSAQSLERLQNHSPIQDLNQYMQQQGAVEQIQVDLNRLNIDEDQIYDVQNKQKMVIKLKKVQNNLNNNQFNKAQVTNVPLVASRVISESLDHSFNRIQSFCIPCQSEIQSQNMLSGYQYAMQQLSKLQKNVMKLQQAVNNLSSIKQNSECSAIMPSSIKKDTNLNKLDQSFIQQLHNSFVEVIQHEINQQIDKKQFKRMKYNDYGTPSKPNELSDNSNNQNILFQIHNCLNQNNNNKNQKQLKSLNQIVSDFGSLSTDTNKQNIQNKK